MVKLVRHTSINKNNRYLDRQRDVDRSLSTELALEKSIEGSTPSRPIMKPYHEIMKKLFEFRWSMRGGSVRGCFVATQKQVDDALGADVYFGEILGKHSEVYGTLEKDALTILTDDQEFIKKAEEYKLIPSGYNPLEYIRILCNECGQGLWQEGYDCDCICGKCDQPRYRCECVCTCGKQRCECSCQ